MTEDLDHVTVSIDIVGPPAVRISKTFMLTPGPRGGQDLFEAFLWCLKHLAMARAAAVDA